eukprot:UN14199
MSDGMLLKTPYMIYRLFYYQIIFIKWPILSQNEKRKRNRTRVNISDFSENLSSPRVGEINNV